VTGFFRLGYVVDGVGWRYRQIVHLATGWGRRRLRLLGIEVAELLHISPRDSRCLSSTTVQGVDP